jgi:hypothetical protein
LADGHESDLPIEISDQLYALGVPNCESFASSMAALMAARAWGLFFQQLDPAAADA